MVRLKSKLRKSANQPVSKLDMAEEIINRNEFQTELERVLPFKDKDGETMVVSITPEKKPEGLGRYKPGQTSKDPYLMEKTQEMFLNAERNSG